MKTIKNGAEVVRVSDEDAKLKVKAGWGYCPKGDWKKSVRDKGKEVKEAKKEGKEVKKEKTKKVKGVQGGSEIMGDATGTDSRPKSAGYEKYLQKKNKAK